MCSIFIAASKNNNKIDHNRCVDALRLTKSRGPDNTFYTSTKNLFIGVNILSLTGVPSIEYHTNNYGVLGYNGEIYNYNKNIYKSDTESLFDRLLTCKDYAETTRYLEGMFCYVFYNKATQDLCFARDVFGEKTLYIYEDNDIILASSTLHGIKHYIGHLSIQTNLLFSYFYTRHFLTYDETIYENVRQLKPGTIEVYNLATHNKTIKVYEHIIDYIDDDQINRNKHKTENELIHELDSILSDTVARMISSHHQCVSFSGGIDSSLIAYYISQNTDNYSLIGTNCIGKDYISNKLEKFQPYFKNKITTLNITELMWCNSVKEVYGLTLQPFGSHNYCTKYILANYLQKKGVRVLFGGEGADELFGGYDYYREINNDHHYNISPYSKKLTTCVAGVQSVEREIHKKLSDIWSSAYSVYKDTVLATSLTDTLLVVGDDGVRNNDQVAGWFGVEGRSPFLHKDVLKFALNLPSKYKRGKPLLKLLFQQKFPNINIEKKQGFAGFPVETQKYYPLNKKNNYLYMQDMVCYDIPTQWKLLNIYYFYESYNSWNIGRTSRK
jgi:asparagine synthase (glutamine-hydrolysing)